MTAQLPVDLDKLAAAKLWLTSTPTSLVASRVGDAPYLTQAVYSLITVASDAVERMATDEHWRLYVNPTWLELADVDSVAAEIAHVTVHLLMDHAGRARSMHVGTAEGPAWREASHAGIAETLAAGKLPPVVRAPDDLRLSGNLSTEERYAVLNRLQLPMPSDGAGESDGLSDDASCGSGCDGLTRTHELPPDAEVGGVDSVTADQIRESVAIAYQGWREDRQPGTTPGEWARFVERVLDPVVPWQQVLSSAVRRAVAWTNGLVDYSYRRPSRRQAAVRNVVLPGMRRPTPDAAIVVDTSGSVDDGLLAQALGEVQGALAACGSADGSVKLVITDAKAHSIQRVRRATDVKLIGGGGTDMRIGITAAAELRPRPDVIIVFTDGDTPWPSSPPPGTVVIAAILGRRNTPLPATPHWATRVECLV
jgi:predicted metal-dependent peptidase